MTITPAVGVDTDEKVVLIKDGTYYLILEQGSTYKTKELQAEKGEDNWLKIKG